MCLKRQQLTFTMMKNVISFPMWYHKWFLFLLWYWITAALDSTVACRKEFYQASFYLQYESIQCSSKKKYWCDIESDCFLFFEESLELKKYIVLFQYLTDT